jgi:peptidoglycan hydrolase-like protein with peptidoglycan-binding domain
MIARQPSRIAAAVALACAGLLVLTASSISVAPSASAATTVVARIGSHGPVVVIIQRAVHASPDGIYGPRTAAAVTIWQRSHHLTATGVVDSLTWSKMSPVAPVASPQLAGNDVSWPQCPKGLGIPSRPTEGKAMPPATASFVVIGLTNGPGFHPNPCLATQTEWATSHHVYTAVYAMMTYPTPVQIATYGLVGPDTGLGSLAKLANTGYAQAQFNVASMHGAGLVSPYVWVDVESYRVAPWSKSTARNKAVLDGALRGYRAAGLKVGVYSTPYLWKGVVGSARYGLPEWRTAGPRSKSVAQDRCSGPSFQGGPAVMSQWTTRPADHDITCPGYSSPAALAEYFHKY